VLNPKDIYSLIALTAFHNKHFGVCSRAFVKLETLPDVSDAVQALALQIFIKNSPLDPSPLAPAYLECLERGTPYTACTASGRLIEQDTRIDRAVACRVCRYSCLERAIQNLSNCPLCHSPFEVGFTNRAL